MLVAFRAFSCVPLSLYCPSFPWQLSTVFRKKILLVQLSDPCMYSSSLRLKAVSYRYLLIPIVKPKKIKNIENKKMSYCFNCLWMQKNFTTEISEKTLCMWSDQRWACIFFMSANRKSVNFLALFVIAILQISYVCKSAIVLLIRKSQSQSTYHKSANFSPLDIVDETSHLKSLTVSWQNHLNFGLAFYLNYSILSLNLDRKYVFADVLSTQKMGSLIANPQIAYKW